jgi:integrase
MRIELLERKSAGKLPEVPTTPLAPVEGKPAAIKVGDVLQNYLERELPKLSGASSDKSRLKKLDAWFGHLTLGQLNYDVLETWKEKRLSGILGSGRVFNPSMSKHERYRLKKAGKAVIHNIAPVKTQTVRHELVVLRRALKAYFRAHTLMHDHGSWLHSQHVMQMVLPEKSEPRDIRVDDTALTALVKELNSPILDSFVRFAVMTTLRRSEVCSLRWDDVDLESKVVRLRAPGHRRKTKVYAREVPLLPPTIAILERLGLKKSGKIFEISPSGISQAVRRAADRAGLADVRLHDLRREGISRLIELLEVSLETVTVFSGHSDLAVLQRHYVKQRPSVIAERLTAHPLAAKMISPM